LKKSYLAILLIFAVLVIDQALKIWVKTSFCYGEERAILGLSWARLNFVENPGMAFGWKFGGEYGKLALSLFRIVAIGFLIYYVSNLIKKGVSNGLISSFSLILAGAIGNIIDSAFYGLIFSNSDYHCSGGPATLFPTEGGYESFLHGRVVDMLFFPLLKDSSSNVLFFQPVFNIADSAITIGVLSILLFQRHYFNSHDEKVEAKSENTTDEIIPESIEETAIESDQEHNGEIISEIKSETETLPPTNKNSDSDNQ
jgi:signal peptidase II